MKKSFSGVSVSMPKVFKREVEECMEAFIDFLKEIPEGAPESLPIRSSNENKAESTCLFEECSEENEVVQLNKCEDNNHQVFFVECPEKDRPSALLCAALGWAQEYQPADSSIDRIILVGGDNETLNKIKQDVEGTDVVNLLQIQEKLPHSAFTAEKMNASVVDVFLTTQQMLCEAIVSTSSKYQNHDSPVEPKKYSLKKTLVIVEDAHLLDQVFRDAASGSLSLCVIESFITNFKRDASHDPLLMNAIDVSETLKRVLFRGIMPHKGRETDPSFSLDELYRLLNSPNIMGFDFQTLGGTKHFNDPNISKIFTFLLLLVNILVDNEAMKQTDKRSPYRMYTSESDTCPYEFCKSTSCKSINFVCLDASFIMKKFMKMNPFALILSSASLSPFSYLKTELGIRKAKEFAGKSSVEDHQMFARILTCGAGGYFFNSSYNRRFDSDYLYSLGRTILELAKVTPSGEGIVIYVSSYEFQDMCALNWQKCAPNKKSLWDTIAEYKDIFTISKGDASQSHLLERLKNSQTSKGSCVLAVLRSQASEYTYLPIQSRRVVVIVGVPFIPTDHPKVQLKIQYNKSAALTSSTSSMQTSRLQEKLAFDFQRWESYKPIRQVVDNLINSSSDYSVILLLDTRYDIKSLSPWLGEKIITEKRFFELLEELTDFFHLVKNRIQWIQDKKENATQTSTQFGSVPKWEMDKLCLEYRKLRNSNDCLEGYLLSLQKQFSDECSQQSELEQKLKDHVSPRKRPFPE